MLSFLASEPLLINRLFENITHEEEQILNEFNCPLLQLSNCLCLHAASCILRPVSILHECTNSCIFTTNRVQSIEREEVETAGLTFVHDYSNNSMYSLNIFNINSSLI